MTYIRTCEPARHLIDSVQGYFKVINPPPPPKDLPRVRVRDLQFEVTWYGYLFLPIVCNN